MDDSYERGGGGVSSFLWVRGMQLLAIFMFLVMIQHQAYDSAAITVLGLVQCTNMYVQSCPRMACTSLIDHMNPLADVAMEPHVEDINGWSMSTQLDQNQQRQLGELLHAHKSAFAYSEADISGYTGVDGPCTIDVHTDKPTIPWYLYCCLYHFLQTLH
ncbi:hypothetical protein NFJ02_03g104260 [Pycnococcus provasolii]